MNKTLKDFMQNRNYRNYRRMASNLNESEVPFNKPASYNPDSIYILAAPGAYTYNFAFSEISNTFSCTIDGNPVINWGDGEIDNKTSHTYYNNSAPRVIEIMDGDEFLQQFVNEGVYGGFEDPNISPFDTKYTIGALHMCKFAYPEQPEWATCAGLFQDCKNLTIVEPNFFENCGDRLTFAHAFAGCTSLTSVPNNLFAGCENVDMIDVFAGCTSLTNLPNGMTEDEAGLSIADNKTSNQTTNSQSSRYHSYPYKYRAGDPDFEQDY